MNLKQLFGLNTEVKKDKTFESIQGHDDVKDILTMALESHEVVHVNLNGPPGVGKTELLLAIKKKYGENAFFTVGAHSTKAGMINVLFEKRPKILLIDELEKMPLVDQAVLLSLMQTGILTETKVKKTRSTQLKCRVFATTNNVNKLSEALQSRFALVNLERYTEEEFKDIAMKMLEREDVEPDMREYIASEVYSHYEKPDMRDIIMIGRMAKNRNDVQKLIKRLSK